jgi:hypothetical protein
LYTPTFVREPPLTRLVNTVTGLAADCGNPGTNIPTWPPCGAGDRSCDVTVNCPACPSVMKSIAPSEPGVAKSPVAMASNAFASRGPSWKTLCLPPNR